MASEITPTSILVCIVGVLAVIMNGVLLIAMARNKRLLFTSRGAYLIANLTIADLLTGLNAVRYGLRLHSPDSLQDVILNSLFWATVEASLLTTFVMSLERYIAIVYPFKAEVCLSKKRTLQSIAIIWLFASICGVLTNFYMDILMFAMSIIFEITVLVTILFYSKIFMLLAERKKVIKSQLSMSENSGGEIPVDKDLQREARLTHVVLALTIIMVITFMPYMVAGQIFTVLKHFSSGHDTTGVLSFVTHYFPVELTNFFLNPIIYAWRLPKYRRALLLTLKCCQKARRRRSLIPSENKSTTSALL